MPVSSSDLTALSGIAGFDVTALFNAGDLNLPDGQFGFSVISPGAQIASQIISNGVDPVQNGIPFFAALAEAQYDDLSTRTLVQLLLGYARAAGTSSAVPQDVGTAIANMVSAGTLTASQAISYVSQAAFAVAGFSGFPGSPSKPYVTGQIVGTVAGQLAGVLGSDPVVATVQDLAALPNGLGTTGYGMLLGLGAANAASIATAFEGLVGSAAQSLTAGDLTLASPSSAGADIANAVFNAFGAGGSNNFPIGATLIIALGQQQAVDPIPALVYFTYQLASLINDAPLAGSSTTLPDAVGTIAGLVVSNALVTGTTAATDITNTVIALAAASTTTSQALLAGTVFGFFGANLPRVSSTSPLVSEISNLDSVIGTTLTVTQGLDVLIAASLAAARFSISFSIYNAVGSAISSLVSNNAISQTDAVTLLAVNGAVGATSGYISSSPGITFAQVVTDLGTSIQNAEVTPAQALTFIGSLVVFVGTTTASTNAIVTLASSLINNNEITASAAFTALNVSDENAGFGIPFGILAATSPTTTALVSEYQFLVAQGYISAGSAIAEIKFAQSNNILTFDQAVELLAVTAGGDNQIFTYINNGNISASAAFADIIAAIAANGGTVEQQIVEIAAVASNTTFVIGIFEFEPNAGLMAAAAQEILTLAQENSLTATDLASAFATAYADEGLNLVNQSEVIALLTNIAGLSGGLTLAAATIANLVFTGGSATAAQPLSVGAAVSDIAGGNFLISNSAVSLLVAVAGQLQNPAFDFLAGQQIAIGISRHASFDYFPTTLGDAVAANAISTIDAALLLGSVATETSASQSPSEVQDFLTLLQGFAGNSSVIPAFGAAVADGYDPLVAVEALALIGGAAPGVQSDAQAQIISIIGSGAESLTGDDYIYSLAGTSQFVAGFTTTFGAAVQTAIAGDIAAIIANGFSTVTSAVTMIGDHVGATLGTVTGAAAQGITLLEYLATFDTAHGGPVANLEQTAGGAAPGTLSVQAEIALIIGANEIGLASTVTALEALQATTTSGTPLFDVTANELSLLDTSGVSLVATAGVGSLTAAQLDTQAVAISQLGEVQVVSGTTDATTASGDTLNFATLPAGVAAGLLVLDLTNPAAIAPDTTVASTTSQSIRLSGNVASAVANGDIIAFYKPPVDTAATNAATASGNVLDFASLPADITQGLLVLDLTNPAAIAFGTTVTSVTGTTVTLSASVAATVGSGDTIAVFQPGIQQVLQALAVNVGNGSASSANAVTLLLDLAAIGAANPANPAQTDASNALVSLAVNGTGGLSIFGVIAQINTALSNGTLAGGVAFTILEAFDAVGPSAASFVESAIAFGLVTGHFTISQLDTAVTGGKVQPLDAIAALSEAAGSTVSFANPAVTVTAITNEIIAILHANPGLNANSVLSVLTALSPNGPSVLSLATDTGNASLIASGYTAINAIVAANSALASGFFSAILGLINQFSGFSTIVTPAENELFGAGGLVANAAVDVNTALTAIVGLPNSAQLPLLVELAAVPSAQSTVLDYVDQVVSNPGNTNTFVTVATSIGAFAAAFGGASALTNFYEELLALLGQNGSGAASFVSDLENSAATTNQQLAILSNLIAVYNQIGTSNSNINALVSAFSSRVGSILTAEAGSPAALASSLGSLFTNGIFTAAQVMQNVASVYNFAAPQEFLQIVAALPADGVSVSAIAAGIVSAVAQGGISAAQGIDMILVAGTQSYPALEAAAASAFAAAVAQDIANPGSTPIAIGAAANIAAAFSLNIVTAGQIVTFVTQGLLAQPTTASFAVDEINTLVLIDGALTGLQAITAMARTLGPLALVGSAATSAATASGAVLDFATVPAGVGIGHTAVDLTDPTAIQNDTVLSATGTTVTLAGNIAAAVASGDTIGFYNSIAIQNDFATLGSAIATLVGSYGFSALQESNAILAAIGSTAADLPPDYAMAILAAFAGQGDGARQLAAGEAVAGLVQAGTITATQAAGDLDSSFLALNVTTAAQLVNVAVGLLAGGSSATAAELVADLLAGNQVTVGTIAAAFSGAIGTGPDTVTALQIVDLAVLLAADSGFFANPAALITPLLNNSILSGQAVVAELANFIGASPGLPADNFMTLFATVAAGAGGGPEFSMGVGLAGLIAPGTLSFPTVAADLQVAINGNPIQNILPIITLGQALEVLVGAAASSLSQQTGETIAGLIGGDATAAQTVASDIEAAVANATLTPAQALTLLAGMVDGGAPDAASAAVPAMYQSGAISLNDLDTLVGVAILGNAPQGAAAYITALAYPVAVTAGDTLAQQTFADSLVNLINDGSFTLSFSGEVVSGSDEVQNNGPDGVTNALLGAPVSGPGIPAGATVGSVFPAGEIILANGVTETQTDFSGTFTIADNAAAVEAQIVAALPPASQLPDLIKLLVALGQAAGPAALGQTLFAIIESGAATAAEVIAQIQATGALGTTGLYTLTPIFALGGLAQIAALSESGTYGVDPATIESDVYDAIVAMYPPGAGSPPLSAAQVVVQGIGALVQEGGVFKAIYLPVLAQLVARDPADYLTAAGGEFTTLLNDGAITADDLVAALQGAGLDIAHTIVALAAAIDAAPLPGSSRISASITAQNQLVVAINNLVPEAPVTPTALQSYVTALQDSGLPAAKIVGALAGIYNYASSAVGSTAIPAVIAGLITGEQINEVDAYTVIGQSYQAIGFSGGELAALSGQVGTLLGDSQATLVSQVAQGKYGATIDATITQLVYLTGIDLQLSGPLEFFGGTLPIGLAIGAQILAMVDANQITLGQALSDVFAVPGGTQRNSVSDNNKMLILVGAAGAGTAAQQVALGAALGNFINAGATPDLLGAIESNFIAVDAQALLLAGIVETGNASLDATVGSVLAAIIQSEAILSPGQLASLFDSAVTGGVLTASAAIDALALAAAGASTGLAFVEIGAIRPPLAGELVKLVNEDAITVDAALAALTALAGAGSIRLQTEAGRLIAALANATLATPTQLVADIDSAIATNALTVAQAIVIDTAISLSGPGALATTLGGDIGGMIAAGDITVANAIGAVEAGSSTYLVGDGTNEVLMLLAAAGADATGLQLAAGEAIGGLLNQGVVGLSATIAAIDNAVGDLTALQSGPLLVGVAQTAGFQAQVAVGGEFSALIASGQLAPSDVIGFVDQAIHAGDLSVAAGFPVLAALAATAGNAPITGAVTGEIAALVNGNVVTPDQALAALYAAAGSQDFGFMPAAIDATIAAIVTGLEGSTAITAAEASQDLVTAASGGSPAMSANHAVSVLLGLAADAPTPAASQSASNALATLLSNGIGAAAFTQTLLNEVNAGTISVDTAVAMLFATTNAVAPAAGPAVEVTIGTALATLVNSGKLNLGVLETDFLDAAPGSLNFDADIGLQTQIAVLLPSTASTVFDWDSALTELAEANIPGAAEVLADMEAVALAAGGNFDNGYGLLIPEIDFGGADPLVSSIEAELRSLVSRGLITDQQAANYITGMVAVVGGLPGAGILMLATSIASPLISGKSIATFINNNQTTIPTALFTISHSGASVDTYIRIIAAMAGDLTASGSLNTLSAALVQLIDGGATPVQFFSFSATASQIFGDIAAVAQLAGGYTSSLGVLLAGMAGTTDTALQTTVGHQLGTLVAAGSLAATAAVADVATAAANGQLTAAQALTVDLASVANGGAAMQAAVGQQLGGMLASQNSAASVSTTLSALTGALSGGTFTASQLAGVLAGMGTVAYSAPNGGTGLVAGAIGAGIMANGSGFLVSASTGFGDLGGLFQGAAYLAEFVSLNQKVLNGTEPLFLAHVDFSDFGFESFFSDPFDYRQITSEFNTNSVDTAMDDLAAALGGFGNNNPQTQLDVTLSSLGVPISDVNNTLNSIVNSGALSATVELSALVKGGQLTATQAMAAVDAVAPFLPASRLVYFLAALTANPSLQTAAPQEIVALVGKGVLTATAAVADIAALINAAPSDDSVLAALSPPTAVSALIGLYAFGTGTPVGSAAAQEIASLLANPPKGYTQVALANQINAAVTSGELTGASATALLVAGAVSAPLLPSSALSTIISTISGYVTAGTTSASALIADTLASAGATANSPITVGAILDGVLGPAQTTAALEGVLPGNQAELAFLGAIAQENLARPANGGHIGTLENAVIFLSSSADVSKTQLVSDILSSGLLTTQEQLTLLAELSNNANPATATAIGQALIKIGGGSIYANDPFFAAALTTASNQFLNVVNGADSISVAIANVELFAPSQNGSTDAALILLYSLLSGVGLTSDAQAVFTEEQNRISSGQFQQELGERVSQGTTTTFAANGNFVNTDPNAISFDAATNLLTTEAQRFDVNPGPFTESIPQHILADDVYVDQAMRDFGYSEGAAQAQLTYGYSQYQGGFFSGVPGSGGGGYPFDQALEVMATQPALTPNLNSVITTGATTAQQQLLARLINGSLETDLVNNVSAEAMTPQEAVNALNQAIAVATTGMSASDAAAFQTLAYGWLTVKSSEFINGNFVEVPGSGGDGQAGSTGNIANPADAQARVYLTSEVNNLYGLLLDNLSQAVKGIGAVMELPSTGATAQLSSFDATSAMELFQGLQADVAGNTTTAAAASAATQPLVLAFVQGFTQLQSLSNAGIIGTIQKEVVGNPKNYQAYLDLGVQLFATGVPGAGIVTNAISALSSYWPSLAEGSTAEFSTFLSQWGSGANGQLFQEASAGDLVLPLAVGALVAQGITAITQIGAVAQALGPTGVLLNGEFEIIGATAGLIPNIVSGLLHAGFNELEAPIKDIVGAFSDLGSHNISGANSFGEQLGDDIFTIESGGFQLNDVAAVSSAAADSFLDLFSGHPGNIESDLKDLGGTIVNLIENNVFFNAVATVIEQYIQTVGQAIANIIPIISDWYQWNYNFFHNIPNYSVGSPPPTPTSLTDVFGTAQQALDNPSNYGEFYFGNADDGYLVGATVFVDENGNGVLDPGEYSTTTDAQGQYSLPAGISGPIVIQGGTDSATGLPFTGKLTAPAGSTSVTPLSTLVQDITAQTGNLTAAEQQVDSALGLPAGTDPTQIDPIATTQTGDMTGAVLYTAGAEVLNTLTMLNSAGATSDPAMALANQIAALPSGSTLDLTDPTTLGTLATASGLDSNTANAVVTLAGASNTMLLAAAASTSDPATLLTDVAAVSNTAQGVTSQALQAAQNDPSQLNNVVDNFTGDNLNNQIQNSLNLVGHFSLTPPATPGAPTLAASSTVGPAGGNVTAVTTPTFTGTATPGDAVTLYEGTTALGTTTAGGDGSYSITATSALPIGSNTVFVTATDAGGNVSGPSPGLTVNVSLNPPTITGTMAGQTTVLEAPIHPFAGAVIADPSKTSTETVTITVGGAGGALSGAGLTGGTGGAYTLTDSAAAITGDIQALVFTPAAGASDSNSTTTFTLSDQSSTYPVPISDETTTVVDIDPATAALTAGGNIFALSALSGAISASGGVPTPVQGSFNFEVVTASGGAPFPSNPNLPLPAGYQGVVEVSGSTVTLLHGDFGIADTIGGSGSLLIAGDGADTIGGAQSDTITGGTGTDFLDGSRGLLSVIGGSAGNETIWGGAGDTISGGSGASVMIGGVQGDTITGGTGAAFIDGSAGNQSITGGSAGNETIWGGAGDTIGGGSGASVAIGGVAGDTITGGTGTIFIDGSKGNQAITGGSAGNETIWGGAGDTISGGTGANVIIGGVAGDTITGGSGTVFIDGSAGNQSITIGSAGNETIWGGAGDTISGGGAATVTIGGAQFDTITGGTGSEFLDGSGGNQSIFAGSAGNETIWGGAGDTITGGSGSALIGLGSGAEFVADAGIAGGSDTVGGFDQAGGDLIFAPSGTQGAVLASAITTSGNTTITFADGSTMTLQGVAHIDNSFFA